MNASYAIQHASLEWDAQGLPFAADYQDVYYSRHDPLGESSHVFVRGNRLCERFAALGSGEDFVIAELGFGAGLNFLNTCRHWCETAPEGATLHFVSCELHPFRREDLERLHAHFPELQVFASALREALPLPCSGLHQLQLRLGPHRVVLSLLYGPAAELPDYLATVPGLLLDAVFLDGFAPSANPGMWAGELFRSLVPFCHAGTTLSTYSVAGSVRRALQDAGFAFEKLPGFAGKRHMLRATLPAAPARMEAVRWKREQVVVVGAGLAGCSTARALADAGWQVVVLEAAAAPASAASGNPRGVLHFKPATVDSPDNRFNLHAWLYALREYRRLKLPDTLWSPCGMLQLAHDAKMHKRFARLAVSDLYPPGIFEVIDAQRATAIAGVTLQQAALHFPGSGWLDPGALCRWYLAHPGITLRCNSKLRTLRDSDGRWQLELATPAGTERLAAKHVVLCTAEAIHELHQTRHIPVICNRGQVDQYTSDAGHTDAPVVCGQGYFLPAGSDGLISVGGSFSLTGDSPGARAADSALHRAQVATTSCELAAAIEGQHPVLQRRATRCTLADRMPVAGSVATTASGAALWVNAAHGSQGLARTPLCAAWLTALIGGTPAPLDAALARTVDPGRFGR